MKRMLCNGALLLVTGLACGAPVLAQTARAPKSSCSTTSRDCSRP
jgi:hypothetical protein